MVKFLLGILVGVLIFFLFLYFGGGKSIQKVGEGLIDTGKKMEAVEELMQKEKDGALKDVKKKILKEEKEVQKKTQ